MLFCEYVHCPQRQHSQTGRIKSTGNIAKAIEDFIKGSIPARRDDRGKPIPHCLRRESSGVARTGRRLERAF